MVSEEKLTRNATCSHDTPSIMLRLISPSPTVLLFMLPLKPLRSRQFRRAEFVIEMLQPGVVGIARRRLPMYIADPHARARRSIATLKGGLAMMKSL
jgi:hypothetical protein